MKSHSEHEAYVLVESVAMCYAVPGFCVRTVSGLNRSSLQIITLYDVMELSAAPRWGNPGLVNPRWRLGMRQRESPAQQEGHKQQLVRAVSETRRSSERRSICNYSLRWRSLLKQVCAYQASHWDSHAGRFRCIIRGIACNPKIMKCILHFAAVYWPGICVNSLFTEGRLLSCAFNKPLY